MAKQVKAYQDGTVLGKIESITSTNVQEFNNGTKYMDYNIRLRLANGVAIFNRDRVFNPETTQSQFIIDKINKYEEIKDRLVEKELIFATKRVKPDKNKEMSFDTLNGYEKKDGTLGFGTQGGLNILEEYEEVFKVDKDGEPILDDNGDEIVEDYEIEMEGRDGTYTVSYNKYANKFVVGMILVDADPETGVIKLEDEKGSDEYPLTVIGEYSHAKMPLFKDGKLLPKIGQGYEFQVKFVKGEAVKTEEQEFSWEEEAKPNFAPDRLVLIPLGILKNLTKEVSVKKGKAKKEAVADEEFPF